MREIPVRLLLSMMFLAGGGLAAQQSPSAVPAAASQGGSSSAVPPSGGSPASSSGQAPAPGLQRRDEGVATLRALARVVLLDVVVTDGQGKSVKGLRPSDFTLLEDGVPQTLASFREHRAPTEAEAAKAEEAVKLPPNHFTNYSAAAEDGASFVILLDALDTPVQAQMYLRQQMIEYMKGIPARTRIAIFQLDTQLRMIQEFTTDRELLQQVVNGKRNQPKMTPLLNGPASVTYVREQMRQDILTQGMQGLAKYLGPFAGRKNLIWFTARVPMPVYGPGFGAPFPDVTSFIDEFSKTTDVLTLNRIAVYPIDARGLESGPVGGGLRAMNRFDRRQFYQHGDLDDVAETTGGQAFYNTNGLKEAIATIVETGSNYYTLSYSPANRVWDGSYRKLQVRLAGEGYHLEYRRGYYARNDEVLASQHVAQLQNRRRVLPVPVGKGLPSPRLNAAMGMGVAVPRDVLFVAGVTPAADVVKAKDDAGLGKDNFLAAKYRKQPFREYTVHFSVNPNTVQMNPSPDLNYHGKMQFVVVVYDETGQVVNSKIANTSLDVDKTTYQRMMQGGFGTDVTVAIPAKGNYFLRMGVHDEIRDTVGAVEAPVDQIKSVAEAGKR